MKNLRIYISFFLLALIMVVMYPREHKFHYEYQVGRPWIYETLISPIDFPILKTDDEILKEKEEKASEFIDYYAYDSRVGDEMVRRISKMSADHNLSKGIAEVLAKRLTELYDAGVVQTLENQGDLSDKVIFIKRDRRVREVPATEVYNVNDSFLSIVGDLRDKFPDENVDSIAFAVNLKSYIVPNLTYDENTSRLMHKEAVNYISPTKGMYYAGQLIVSNGELVTSEIAQVLDSYKAEYTSSFGFTGSETLLQLGHILTVLVLLSLVFLNIYYVEKSVLENTRQLVFLLLMVFIAYCAVVVLMHVNQRLLFLFPFAALILYMSAFFKNSMAGTLYIVSLLPMLLIVENGVELFFINAVAGGIALVGFKVFNRGWKIFINSILIFIGMVLALAAFRLQAEGLQMFAGRDVLFLLLNAVMTIILYPFVYLFEKLFSFVSYTRLWELTDTNNKLLDELSKKAPGTFQHSLQVANMASAAAHKIGGDEMLVRVGALYHDIGKSLNPQCFIENRAAGAEDYHASLTPVESAHDIIRHMEDGLILAKKNSLPEVVTDFIRTHHGTSTTLYFYNKYCNEGGNPEDRAKFTYPGSKPATKEQVILMITDAVEAASRTLKDYSPESISNLVDNITRNKNEEGQFIDSDISMKDIGEVKESLKSSLMQIYHARIVYPKRNV